MNWRNAEQYPDHTAAEAMFHVMHPDAEQYAVMDDSGARSLVEAVVRQAAEDYARALRQEGVSPAGRIRETEGFFRSRYFRRLTGLDGGKIIRLIRREVESE